MVFFLLNVFARAFSGADFNLRDRDGVSLYRLSVSAVDRFFRRLLTSFKDGVVLDATILLILPLFVFQLKEKGRTSPKATLKSTIES